METVSLEVATRKLSGCHLEGRIGGRQDTTLGGCIECRTKGTEKPH